MVLQLRNCHQPSMLIKLRPKRIPRAVNGEQLDLPSNGNLLA